MERSIPQQSLPIAVPSTKRMSSVSIKNFTRHPVPRFAYDKIADLRLPGWEISLVFAGRTRAQRLNRELRGKLYVPNVLSYEVGSKSGEIIICPETATRQAPLYDLSPSDFMRYLFIHGILHLEGRPHGVTMEKWEQKLFAQFAKGRLLHNRSEEHTSELQSH